MPTPMFNIRLAPEIQEGLKKMAVLHGAKDTSDFTRQILDAVSSSDRERIQSFMEMILRELGEQLQLPLNAIESVTVTQRKEPPERGRN